MVESIGPNRISAITRSKAVNKKSVVDKPGRDRKQRDRRAPKPQVEEQETRVGANIDEVC